MTHAHASGLNFAVTSPTVTNKGRLPGVHVGLDSGCRGGNTSPALNWEGAPAATKSFAVTVFDPDAQGGTGWWHWLVYDIPASTQHLDAGAGSPGARSLPKGSAQGANDFDNRRFDGACPPIGDGLHRYQFTVHAMKRARLYVPLDATPKEIGDLISANELDHSPWRPCMADKPARRIPRKYAMSASLWGMSMLI